MELLLINEAAKLMQRSSSMVRLYEASGRLPAIRASGGLRLFKKSDVEKLARELGEKKRPGKRLEAS